MPNIYIKFYHPDLNVLSDRTFRSFLKGLSKVLRKVETQEILTLIESSELTDSEKQSVRDHFLKKVQAAQTYYIEKLERGSTGILVLIGLVLYLAFYETIRISIQEAYKQSKMHKAIVDYLTGKRGRERSDIYKSALESVGKIDRFKFAKIEKISKKDRDEIYIPLVTEQQGEKEFLTEEIDYNFIVKKMEDAIKQLGTSGQLKNDDDDND